MLPVRKPGSPRGGWTRPTGLPALGFHPRRRAHALAIAAGVRSHFVFKFKESAGEKARASRLLRKSDSTVIEAGSEAATRCYPRSIARLAHPPIFVPRLMLASFLHLATQTSETRQAFSTRAAWTRSCAVSAASR